MCGCSYKKEVEQKLAELDKKIEYTNKIFMLELQRIENMQGQYFLTVSEQALLKKIRNRIERENK